MSGRRRYFVPVNENEPLFQKPPKQRSWLVLGAFGLASVGVLLGILGIIFPGAVPIDTSASNATGVVDRFAYTVTTKDVLGNIELFALDHDTTTRVKISRLLPFFNASGTSVSDWQRQLEIFFSELITNHMTFTNCNVTLPRVQCLGYYTYTFDFGPTALNLPTVAASFTMNFFLDAQYKLTLVEALPNATSTFNWYSSSGVEPPGPQLTRKRTVSEVDMWNLFQQQIATLLSVGEVQQALSVCKTPPYQLLKIDFDPTNSSVFPCNMLHHQTELTVPLVCMGDGRIDASCLPPPFALNCSEVQSCLPPPHEMQCSEVEACIPQNLTLTALHVTNLTVTNFFTENTSHEDILSTDMLMVNDTFTCGTNFTLSGTCPLVSTVNMINPLYNDFTIVGGPFISVTGGMHSLTLGLNMSLMVPVEFTTFLGGGMLHFHKVPQAANTVWAGPLTNSSGNQNPTFRLLTEDDLPLISAASHLYGTLDVFHGGTGSNTSFTPYSLIVSSSSGLSLTTGSLVPGFGMNITNLGGNFVIGVNTTLVELMKFKQVGLAVPTDIFNVTSNPVLQNGTLSFAVVSQLQNTVWAAPSAGGAGIPSFRLLTEADIPPLNASTHFVGILPVSNGGTGSGVSLTGGTIMVSTNENTIVEGTLLAGPGIAISITGTTVNISNAGPLSVGLAVPAAEFAVTTGPVTTGAGTLTFTKQDQLANLVWAGPTTGVPGQPAFRLLVAADIPVISAATGLSGVLSVAHGGTGSSASLNGNRVIVSAADGSSLVEAPLLTDGKILIGNSTGGPVMAHLTGGSGITVVNAPGSITLKTTGSCSGGDKISASCLDISGQTCSAPIGSSCMPQAVSISSLSVAGSTFLGTNTSCVAPLQPSCYDISSQTCTAGSLDANCIPSTLYLTSLTVDSLNVLNMTHVSATVADQYTLNVTVLDATTFNLHGGMTCDVNGSINQDCFSLADKQCPMGHPLSESCIPASLVFYDTSVTHNLTVNNVQCNGNPLPDNCVKIDEKTCSAPVDSSCVPLRIRSINGILPTDHTGLPPFDFTFSVGTGMSLIAEANGIMFSNTGVTHVELSAPSEFIVSGSPVMDVGTLTFTKATQAPRSFWAGPATGVLHAQPSFRPVLITDLPALSEGQVYAGTGTGVVATNISDIALVNVILEAPTSLFSVTGSPLTTLGQETVTFSLISQNANTFFAGPNGTSGLPTFRSMLMADLPPLLSGHLYVGTGTGVTSAPLLAGAGIYIDGTMGSIEISNTGVTSVGLSLPGSLFSVSGSPVTTTGTLTATLATQVAKTFWAGPSAGNPDATPTFRGISLTDLPATTAGAILVGTGTGVVAGSINGIGDIVVTVDSNGNINITDTLPHMSVGLSVPAEFSVSGSPLTGAGGTITLTKATQASNLFYAGPSSGADAQPTFRALNTADLSGILTTNGQILMGSTGGSPVAATLTAGANIVITNSPGGILISASINASAIGTVTSVDMTVPSALLSVTGGPVTSSGTFAVSLASQTANKIFASPNGSTGTPTFRSMALPDMPVLGTNQMYLGVAGVTSITTLAAGTGLSLTTSAGTTTIASTISVGLSMPSIFTVTNSPVTTTGTLTATLNTQTANTFLAGPTTGVASAPTFRGMVLADLPGSLGNGQIYIGVSGSAPVVGSLAAGTGITITPGAGTLTVTNAGVTSVGLSLPGIFTVSGSPVTSTGTLTATLATQLTNLVFASPNGSTGAPTFRSLAATDIPSLDASKITTGTLPVARGGTNSATALNNNRIMVSSAGAIVEAAALTNGQLLIGSTGAAPVAAALTGTAPITIASGAGSITFSIAAAGVTNGMLANSALTVTAGTGLSGGGSVSLGGTTTLNLANTAVTPGTYSLSTITVDAQGRITAASSGSPSSGEANTASNVGVGGVGVFKQKTGVNLEFRSVAAASSKVSVVSDVANNEIDVDVVPSNIDHDALLNYVANKHVDHSSVSITAGTGLTGGGDLTASRSLALDVNGLTEDLSPALSDYLLEYDVSAGVHKKVLISSLPGFGSDLTTASNVGTMGVGVFKQKTVNDLEFKKLAAGSNKVTVTDDVANSKIVINVMDYEVDHDELMHYEMERHYRHDHVNIFAGEGCSGGGDITTNRTISLNVNGLAEDTTPGASDYLLEYDVSASAHKKVQIGNLPGLYKLSSITLGDTAIEATPDSGNGNIILATSFSLGQVATIQSMSFYVTTAAGNLYLGIYSDNGAGSPGTLLASTASFVPTTGWNTQVVTTPVALAVGTYWLAYLPSSSSLAFRMDTSVGSTKYYAYTFGDMPSTWTTAGQTSITTTWSLYATLTVQGVGLDIPKTLFSVTNSPLVNSGTFNVNLISQSANTVFAAPNGAGGAPTFRLLAAADVPSLDVSKITTGTLPVARGGTNSATALNSNRIMVSSAGAIVEAAALTNGQVLLGSTGAAPVAGSITAGNTGITVTAGAGTLSISNAMSVAMTVPSFLSVSGSPLTGSGGTLALSLTSQATANAIFASPAGAGGTPTFRRIVTSDFTASGSFGATNGQLMIGRTGLAPLFATLTAGNGATITNGAGSITVAYSHKENVAAITGPGVSDDSVAGYSIGSQWFDTVLKKGYMCVDASVGAANWKEITVVASGGLNWLGAWNSGTAYALNDGVSLSGSSYICISAHTNQSPPNALYWDVLAAAPAPTLPFSDLVASDTTITTLSTSYVLATSMTLTPPAGTYMVTFTVGGLTHTVASACTNIEIYVGGIGSSSDMKWCRGGSQAAVTGALTAVAKVTVNGSQAIEGRWKTTETQASMSGKTLSIIAVG